MGGRVEVVQDRMRAGGGLMTEVSLPLSYFEGDSAAFPRFSSWRLFEDGVELGPCHAAVDDIRTLGRGRYAHWSGCLFFSSSDGTDPAVNGRRYDLRRVGFPVPGLIRKGGLAVGHVATKVLGGIVGLGLVLLLRLVAWSVFLPEVLSGGRNGFDRADFASFYIGIFSLGDPPWPSMLTEYLRQYLDRENFRRERITDPSLEIAVAEGASSISYLNYPFTTGTEYCYEFCKRYASRLPHQEFLFFDLKQPQSLEKGPYKTIVMIHSIDDFDSPDTDLVFEAFDVLLDADGKVLLSGFTDEYERSWFPFHLYRRLGGRKSFREYRGLHPENFLDRKRLEEFAVRHGLHLTDYREFICDTRFRLLYVMEKFIFKRFGLGRLRKAIWSVSFLRDLHVRASSLLASAILRAEETAVHKGRRGLNFYGRLSRGSEETRETRAENS